MNKANIYPTVNWLNSETDTLIKKYNQPVPRYTSYPPATFFNPVKSPESFIKQVKESNYESPENISFYFHIPFCPQLCHFCGCTTGLSQGGQQIQEYIDALCHEFKLVSQYLNMNRKVSQIHFGGGTPNAISMRHIGRIVELIDKQFALTEHCEIAMECNPAYLSYNHIDQLAAIGFNRLSLGIQDTNIEVLKIINRKPSKIPLDELVWYIRTKAIAVNLDFVYGLPQQTVESFSKTISEALSLRPQRLVTFSYAHVPWVNQHQKQLEQYNFPQANDKLAMLNDTYNQMVSAGYVPIGLDHFALPADELAVALSNNQLHRNFMGYCSKEKTGQVYAFGASGISQLTSSFSQNEKNTTTYTQQLLAGVLPKVKEYQLSQQDCLCRDIIQDLMCNYRVNLTQIADQFGVDIMALKAIVNFNQQQIDQLIIDGIIQYTNEIIKVLPKGRMFIRNVAVLFDPLFEGNQQNKYSKTI